MNSFEAQWQRTDWDNTKLMIYSQTREDVQRVLQKSHLDLRDMAALLSPAAGEFLPIIANRAARLTRQRFGHMIQLFAPMYLSNLCANVCTYCGFSMNNRIKRKVLSLEEIERECLILKSHGFDSVLLVTGEHQNKVGLEYFKTVLPQIKRYFSYIALEVQPLLQDEYQNLRAVGLDGVLVYQESYQARAYAAHHLKGNKTDFFYRLRTAERAAKAGVDKIGIGALLGLEDWRVESFFTAMHLRFLERQFWKTRYSVSFPRIRPCEGGVTPTSLLTDKQLLQLICVFRLWSPQVDLSLSTRESATFRDRVLPFGITSMSAGSKTEPGGYAAPEQALAQFSTADERTPSHVTSALKRAGFEPVFQDWQRAFSTTI